MRRTSENWDAQNIVSISPKFGLRKMDGDVVTCPYKMGYRIWGVDWGPIRVQTSTVREYWIFGSFFSSGQDEAGVQRAAENTRDGKVLVGDYLEIGLTKQNGYLLC